MMARHVVYLVLAFMIGALSLFQSSPYMVWASFELNLFMISPFLLNREQFAHPTKGAIIYFGCQSIASVYMIGGAILQDLGWSGGSFFFLSGFFCKLGVFPFYSWVPRTMVSLSWMSCLVLMTVQKLFPILCVPSVNTDSLLGWWFAVSLGISALVAGSMMFFQTNLKAGLAYSSVLNMSWVLSLKLSSESGSGLFSVNTLVAGYLLLYFLVVLSVVSVFMLTQVQTLADVALFQWGRFRWVSYLGILSLSGVPGLMGFLPKAMVVMVVVSFSPILIAALLLSSAFSILWYTTPVAMAGVSQPAYSEADMSKGARLSCYMSSWLNLSGIPFLFLLYFFCFF